MDDGHRIICIDARRAFTNDSIKQYMIKYI